jgi:hypothetical protein
MSLNNTKMLELRAQSPNLDQWTLIPSRYGAHDVFSMQTNSPTGIISQELLNEAATAVGRDVKVPVYDSENVTIGSVRSATIADSENTSTFYTLTFVTYAWGFTHVPSMYLNNEMQSQRDWNRKFMKYLYKFADVHEAACLSALSTNKCQVFNDLLGLYTSPSNVVIAPNAIWDEVIGDLTPIMQANDFYGNYHMVGNAGLQSRLMKLAEKGIYNQENKTIQYADKQLHFTNNLANEAGHVATGYVVNDDAVGLAFRHEREAILGTRLPDGTEWRRDVLPMLNVPIDTYFYYGAGDYSAIGGASTADMTRVAKEFYGYAIEVAYVVAYNTDLATYPHPIVKFAISST